MTQVNLDTQPNTPPHIVTNGAFEVDNSIKEKPAVSGSPAIGVIVILLAIFSILAGLYQFSRVLMATEGNMGHLFLAILWIVIFMAASTSVLIQPPGQATVLEFFGDYKGTVRRTGIVATLPFMKKIRTSVKIDNFETPLSKVNDTDGNPINISAIVVWQLKDTAKATYAVEDYTEYLSTQAEAAVRHVASQFQYDADQTIEGQVEKPSLLKNADEVNQRLADEVAERGYAAGIDIIEVRINNLSYSVEIAQAMLQRQQANAILSARKIIVEGAVGIVEEAAAKMGEKAEITPAQKADLMSNLLVVLVSESRVTPTINAGH